MSWVQHTRLSTMSALTAYVTDKLLFKVCMDIIFLRCYAMGEQLINIMHGAKVFYVQVFKETLWKKNARNKENKKVRAKKKIQSM